MSYYAIYYRVSDMAYELYAIVKGKEFMNSLVLKWEYSDGYLSLYGMRFDNKNLYYGDPETEPQDIILYHEKNESVENYKHLFIAKELSCCELFRLVDELRWETLELEYFLLHSYENIWYMNGGSYYWSKP